MILLNEKEKLYLKIDTEKCIVVDGEKSSFVFWLEASQVYEEYAPIDFSSVIGMGDSKFVVFIGPVYDPNTFKPKFDIAEYNGK